MILIIIIHLIRLARSRNPTPSSHPPPREGRYSLIGPTVRVRIADRPLIGPVLPRGEYPRRRKHKQLARGSITTRTRGASCGLQFKLRLTRLVLVGPCRCPVSPARGCLCAGAACLVPSCDLSLAARCYGF